MLPLDYVHAVCLAGVAVYIWQREPPRLLLTPLMLISFFVLYGAGNIIYFAGADTVPEVHRAVTLSLILMWFCIVIGMEFARACMPVRTARAAQVIRDWKATRVADRSHADQLLAALGIIVALFILGMFLYLGKPSQLHNFFSFDLTQDKTRYRADFSGGGGYVYQILVASVAAFVSFLLSFFKRLGRLMLGYAESCSYRLSCSRVRLWLCASQYLTSIRQAYSSFWAIASFKSITK